VKSILPGELAQCLITSVSPLGLNVQVLGYFEGTIDEYHLPPGDPVDNFNAGKKVKARVLYEIPGTSPPRFSLSLASHIIALEQKAVSAGDGDGDATSIDEAYPVGTTLDSVKIVKVEPERGLLADVQEGIQGFVHVSTCCTPLPTSSSPPRSPTRPTTMFHRYLPHLAHGKLALHTVLGSRGIILLMASCSYRCVRRFWSSSFSGSRMFKSGSSSRAL
jgi:hypothetical protein